MQADEALWQRVRGARLDDHVAIDSSVNATAFPSGTHRPSSTTRRAVGLGWIALAGAATAALIFYDRLHTRLFSDFLQSTPTMQVAMDLMRLAIPLAAVVVLLRARRSRARVADLVVGLSDQGLLEPARAVAAGAFRPLCAAAPLVARR